MIWRRQDHCLHPGIVNFVSKPNSNKFVRSRCMILTMRASRRILEQLERGPLEVMSGHIIIVPWNTCEGFLWAHSVALKHCPRTGRSKSNLYLTSVRIFMCKGEQQQTSSLAGELLARSSRTSCKTTTGQIVERKVLTTFFDSQPRSC